MTPVAASRPKAEPPERTRALRELVLDRGESRPVSREAAAADVDAAGVGAVEEDDGDAGHGLFVLGVAEADALDVRDGDMVHRDDSFGYDVFLMIPHFPRRRKPLLSGGKSGMIWVRILGGV